MKDAFFVARLHPKEYADYCASMRESNKVSDTAQKETDRLKMMRDADISEGEKGPSNGVGEKQTPLESATSDATNTADKDLSASSSDSKVPSTDSVASGEELITVKVEGQPAPTATESDPSSSVGTPSASPVPSADVVVKIEIIVPPVPLPLTVEVSQEAEVLDSDTKDEEHDAPPQTPSGAGNGVLSPTGSRSSRRVKGRGIKLETPVFITPGLSGVIVPEEIEEKEIEAPIEIAIEKKDSRDIVLSTDIGVSESKTNEEDTTLRQDSISSAAVESSIKEEQVETVAIKSEEEVKEETPAGDSVPDAAVSNTVADASSSSSSWRSPTFAIPGTTKVEIIKGVFLADDTEDVDDTLESEHFDTRQSFLNLCQGNHYQFDQLRRAKHTSMMVLYHMHNPDAPKFVPNCNVCHKDILVGHKYRCEPCEQDYCPTCYSIHGARMHIHPLRAMAVSAVVAPPTLTDEQRRQRQQAIDLHLTLLVHASSCVLGSDCKSRHCQKMKVSFD